MPFTEGKDRQKMDRLRQIQAELHQMELDVKPGDLCFVQYRRMMREWKKQRRWTTADSLLAPLIPNPEERAYALAYLVFFSLHVMDYERQKRRENGDISGDE